MQSKVSHAISIAGLQKLLIGSNSIMSKDTVFNSLFVII
jgi:hypothetical protein